MEGKGKAFFMKHIDLISRIVEAEQKAQALAAEAKEKKLNLRDELRVNTEGVRRDYLSQADRRISRIMAQENERTDNAIKELNERHAKDMESMERLYAENRAAWSGEIYAMVIDPS